MKKNWGANFPMARLFWARFYWGAVYLGANYPSAVIEHDHPGVAMHPFLQKNKSVECPFKS